MAGNVATNPGAIGAVQVKYATDLGFGPSTPAHGVASVLNASGKYTQPTPVDVASALAYATQLPNGTHQLNFSGVGPNVYNPSTYSYLLAKTTGWRPGQGGGAERLRQLRADARTGGVAELRLRLARALARAVRGQGGARQRAGRGGGHRGRKAGLRLR